MAVQDAGLGKGPDGDSMKDQTSYNARSGAAKKTQTSFDVAHGMKDMTKASGAVAGIGPDNPGDGPDASSPNPLDPSPSRAKEYGPPLKSSWDMKDANGDGVDTNIGGKVLGEAILSGSAKLPEGESYSTDSPKRPD